MRRVCVFALCLALLLSACGPRPAVTIAPETAPPARTVSESDTGAAAGVGYVLNPFSQRFHRPGCAWAAKIAPEHRIDWTGDREDLIAVGYQPCHYCKP